MSGMTDAELFAPPAPVQAAPKPAARSAVPPLPNEPDESLLARTALAEGDPNHPESWRNVIGVVRNRAAKSGKSVAEVLAEPHQFEAYSNGHIQAVDTASPQYKQALAIAQGVKAGDTPYDSFYNPRIVAERGVTPPFAPEAGTTIGTQVFGNGGAEGAPAGLTPEQQKEWDALQVAPATTPPGQKPAGGRSFTVGDKQVPVTEAQQKYLTGRKLDPSGIPGTAGMPFVLQPHGNLPATPGAHYVDLDGVEHVVPGGVGGFVKSVAQGALQGIGPDVLSSINKLSGGGFADPATGSGVPNMDPAFSQQIRQETTHALGQQQHDYSVAHMGDQAAQGGRFVGQAVPATAAAAAVPEVELPGLAARGALGVASRVGGRVITNALRGVAGVSPTVGASDAPVEQQLATGALAGVAIPAVLSTAPKAAAAVAGLGRAASPEVAALADTAIDKYKIPLRSGQIHGVEDRSAAYRDSELLSAPGSGTASNAVKQAQAFTKAVAGTIGSDHPRLTPEVMDQARRNIGSVFEGVAKKTGVAIDDQLFHDLAQVGSQARELGLDQSQINALDLQVKKITDLAARHEGDGIIPGDAYQSVTQSGSSLARIMKNDHGSFADLASDVRSALDDAVTRASSPEDVAALQQARFQWKNLKTIQPLAAKAGPDGLISPVALRTRVMTQFPNYAFGDGGDLGELARIGQTFMKEPPQSGTAPRLMDAIKRSALGVGAGLEGALMLHDPGAALKLGGAAAGVAALRYGGNALRGLVNNNPISTSIALRSSQEPGAVLNALSGVRQVTRPTEIPLSALGGNFLLNRGASPSVGATP